MAVVRGLRGRQHRACHSNAHAGKRGAGRESRRGACRRDAREIIALRFIPTRRKAARPTRWPFRRTAGHSFRRQRGQQRRHGGGHFQFGLDEDRARRWESVSRRGWIYSGGLVSERAGGQPGQSNLVCGQWQGLASRANFPAAIGSRKPEELHRPRLSTISATTLQGAVSFISQPDAAQMAAYTAQVRRNSPYTPEQFQQSPHRKRVRSFPDKLAQPARSNTCFTSSRKTAPTTRCLAISTTPTASPPATATRDLTMYGETVTPNHHQLARDYVLLGQSLLQRRGQRGRP